MKIILTGGGTAGHVTPNIALINKLKQKDFEVHYIGTASGIEKTLMSQEGVPYYNIVAGKLRRYLSLENLKDVLKIVQGYFGSLKHLNQIKPNIVFSKGGFVSCPVVWAAKTLRIPVIIHESDITPGLANKLSMPFAKKVCYAFPNTSKHIPKEKAVFSGIPIREEILSGSKAKGLMHCDFNKNKKVILILGGSLGSKHVNDLIRQHISQLTDKYQVCHICGKDGVEESLKGLENYKQYSYVNKELKDMYAMADIVISRAGATTLYELVELKKPNILIPLPKAVSRGDQILNANYFKDEGFSRIIEEGSADERLLVEIIDDTLLKADLYTSKMNKFIGKNSVDTIINVILDTAKPSAEK